MTGAEIQNHILRYISRRNVDKRLGRGQHYLVEGVRNTAPGYMGEEQIMEGVWSLIGQGLAYINYLQPAPENWSLEITAKGRAIVNGEKINPDDPDGYIKRLHREVPDLSETVKIYTCEAVYAYNAQLYRSSAVMLGVASEAAVLEVAPALAHEMGEKEKQKYLQNLKSRTRSYNVKFEEFRKKLESKRGSMPKELTRLIDLTMHSVGDLARVHRNNVGHPTGEGVDRNDCSTLLTVFVPYAKKLYAIKAHLEKSATSP